MYKILVTGEIAQEGLDYLDSIKEVEVDFRPKLPRQEILEIIESYDALITRSETDVDAQMMERGKNLKIIGRGGVGVNNIDLKAATALGIAVTNTPAANTISAAEHTWALILACARNLCQASYSLQKEKKWERSNFRGLELRGKTLGVVGLGRIGSAVAVRAKAFGMKVTTYDPFIDEVRAARFHATLLSSMEKLVEEADVITVHVPLMESTYDLINAKHFEMMKEGVVIINCARGGVINEGDLLSFIKRGKVASAGVDVFEREPAVDNPLILLDQVVATPHLAASTKEAQKKVGHQVAEQVCDYLKYGRYSNIVNLPVMDGEVLEAAEPYLQLAERLGMMQSQIIGGLIAEVEIELSGQDMSQFGELVEMSYLKGLLSYRLGDSVNYINVKALASAQGIVLSRKQMGQSFNEKMTLGVRLVNKDKDDNRVLGVIDDEGRNKIILINGMSVEVEAKGNFIFFLNEDRPGVLGKVCTLLGNHEVNIADLRLGRSQKDGVATALIEVDEEVKKDILESIEDISEIIMVKFVKLFDGENKWLSVPS